jgi:hypothetical protein
MTSHRDGRRWIGELALPAWEDFLAAGDRPVVTVDVNPEAPGIAPTAGQLATLRHLESIQVDLRTVVEAELRRYYDSVRPKYLRFAEKHPEFFEDFAKQMPPNPEPATFARLHTLQGAFVHPVTLHDLAYVGLSFRASWEDEHGVGVLVHDRRVVEVGNADVSFLQWIAEQDRDDSEARSRDGAG